MHATSRICAAASLALTFAATAFAQLPSPPGSTGFLLFTETTGSGTPDQLVAIDTSTIAPGSVTGNAFFRLKLSTSLPGGTNLPNLQTSTAFQRRTFEAAEESPIELGFDGVSPLPVAFVQAVDPATGQSWVHWTDFRTFPSITAGGIPLGVNPGPYDILLHPQRPFVYFSGISAGPIGGSATISEVSFSGTPALTATYTANQAPTICASRMLFDAGSGRISLPLKSTVEVVTPGLGAPFALKFIVPTNTGHFVGTNLNGSFAGGNQQNVIFGTRALLAGAGGYAFVTYSPATGAITLSANNPFGIATGNVPTLSPGFHEIAVVPGVASSVAVFLVSDFPSVAAGSGNGFACTVSNPTGGGPPVPGSTGNLAFVPFGNPAVMSNNSDVVFLGSAGAVDMVGFTGTGIANPLLAATKLTCAGALMPSRLTQPYPLATTSQFVVPEDAGAAPVVERFTVGAGPSLTSTQVVALPSPAASLGNVLASGLLGPQPIFTQAYSGFDGIFSPLLAGGALFFTQPALGAAVNTIPAGGFVLLPTSPPAASFGARESNFNFAAGASTRPVAIHPADLALPANNGAPTQTVIFFDFSTSGSTAAAAYQGGGVLTSEIKQF